MATKKKAEPESEPQAVTVASDDIEGPQEVPYVSPEIAQAMAGEHVTFDFTLTDPTAPNDSQDD